jgi:hypothetical protein
MSDLSSWNPKERRRFLKAMGAMLGALGATPSLRFACNELGGGLAYAQQMAGQGPLYFVEVNLRDQWTHDHLAVYPSLAGSPNLKRANGDPAGASLFYGPNELVKHTVNGTELFLTDDSKSLAPHLDNIAIFEMNEVSVGAIHGHEAANPNRSPGRSYQQTGGKRSMFEIEKGSNHPQGCEAYYSSTPTPASLHNYFMRQQNPGLKNGVAFKGISRSLHTVYHFAANLAGAELDRKQSASQMYSSFPNTTVDLNTLRKPEYAQAFVRLVKQADERFLKSRNVSAEALASHLTNVDRTRASLYEGSPKVVSLQLTPMEEAAWGADVPAAVIFEGRLKADLWRQMAWASKLFIGDLVRTVALEFDYEDYHGVRKEDMVRKMAKQISLPLSRFIDAMKAANLWDQTLVAVYTADGSRETRLESNGDRGKNSVLLCGGRIRGGLYGDIRVAGMSGNGNRFSYHAPDPMTGIPIAAGAIDGDNTKRTPGAVMWRTVAKAMGVPDSLAGSFPDTQNAKPMTFALK